MVEPLATATKFSTIGVATTLGWENDECAKEYMQQLLVRGHVILSAHNWKIKHLKEFYPRSARLLGLNVNKGDEVCVRFRSPGAKKTFLPFHEVLCTLLHEIAHCRYSRHDRYFWELYAQLVIECERLEVRMASEKREDAVGAQLRFSEGRRLGGNTIALPPSNSDSLRQILADAAQRRLQLSRRGERDGCACDSEKLDGSVDGARWICERCGNTNASAVSACDFCSDISGQNGELEEGWDCRRCAFHNYRHLELCEACGFPCVAPAAGQSTFGVRHVSVLTVWPDYLSACNLLGRLADSLDPLLQERRWHLLCLEEFSPQTPSVVSQGEFPNAARAIVKVRLRLPNQPSELLPLAYVYSAVLHQLAHMVERSHDVAFLKEWASLLQCFLKASATRIDLGMTCEIRESMLGFTKQLECLTKAHESGKRAPLNMLLAHPVFADCGSAVKRERSPNSCDAERQPQSTSRAGRRPRSWACTRCSFLDHVDGFLFCEMCGAPRELCAPTGGEKPRMPSCEEPVIILDDDCGEEQSSNDSESMVVVLV
ncbi:hypothetical protein DQ04_03091050 [Trypanosoma grayi]|uniref:hypothetical protein n=1 Tax=Trypanosoma grayi TaxID=71804 RepID=UPI0004F453BE|nr:hypothetical protein DQ04_03091050 [Trypanosoma grayi]KEG10979.1 hypothetical protein DQ04_03091050 [Trypanosoma grayi]